MEDIALLTLRLVVGLLFVGHGAQKLFGWFGSYGINGTVPTRRNVPYRKIVCEQKHEEREG